MVLAALHLHAHTHTHMHTHTHTHIWLHCLRVQVYYGADITYGPSCWRVCARLQVPAIVGAPSSLVVILFAGSFMVVEMVDVMTSNKDDDFSKFHAHDSNAGMTLMALQVVFCILFVYSITNTIKVVPPRLKTFCQSLTVAGVLWFLTTPTFVRRLYSPCIPPVYPGTHVTLQWEVWFPGVFVHAISYHSGNIVRTERVVRNNGEQVVLAPMFSKVWRHRFVSY